MMAMPGHYEDFLSGGLAGSGVGLQSPRTAVCHIYNMRVMCHLHEASLRMDVHKRHFALSIGKFILGCL